MGPYFDPGWGMRVRSLIMAVAVALVAVWCGSPGALASPVVPEISTAPTAGPQLVQSAGATQKSAAKSLTAAFPAVTGAGDLLVLSASLYTGTSTQITSVTDSAGGSWTRIGAYASSGHNSDGEMWYSPDARPVTQVTVHTASAVVVALTIQEFSGIATSNPLDVAAGTSKPGTSPSSGPVTPTGTDLAVGFIAGHGSAQAIKVTAAGYTAQAQQTSLAAHVTSVVTGYQALSTASTQNFTGSLGTAGYWAAGIATFKPATAPNGFSIGATPGSVTLTAGQRATFTISTSVTSGVTQPVALSLTGLPVGASASFSPSTISAGQNSVLTISTSISVPPATSSLTVTGTGTSTSQSIQIPVTVNTPAAIRGAFYYPWFPEAWTQQGQNPFTNYTPTRGFYSTDTATVTAQIADMQYGDITIGIASWFGPGTTTDKHWPALMQAAKGTGFAWAPYYEPEGISNPAPQQIADDLHYIESTYGGAGSALASLPGQGMPVFVYNADDLTTAEGCGTVDRWNQARQLLQQQYGESVYIDLKVFPGYTTCAGTPMINGWHQYGPASAVQDFPNAPGDSAYSISPGYWKSGAPYGTAPFLVRDRARWQANIAGMNASGAKWQLITTYNEWGEGTAIESSSGCAKAAPAGAYCDWSGGNTVSDFITDLHNAPHG
jgi:hypothetical protein